LLENYSQFWQPLGIIFTYLTLVIILAEGLNRFTHLNSEFTRKVVHIGTGNIILFAWWYKIPSEIVVMAAAIASIMAITSYFLPILPSINSVGRQSLGTLFYAISIGLLVAIFWHLEQPQYAAIGILIMTWGDGLAAIIGQNFGQHPYQILGNKKSWEGTLTMVLVSYLVNTIILVAIFGNLWQIWLLSLIVALIAASLEIISWLGLDNFTVPVGSAMFSFLLSKLLLLIN
jgi:phytol kinase